MRSCQEQGSEQTGSGWLRGHQAGEGAEASEQEADQDQGEVPDAPSSPRRAEVLEVPEKS